jgi:hypothetical protein
LLLLLLLGFQPAAADNDPATAVQEALARGAEAGDVIDVLQNLGVPLGDAIVIAINNSPQIMAGSLTLAAMERAEPDAQEEIGYLALTAATGVGACTVAEAIGMPQPPVCAEMLRQ